MTTDLIHEKPLEFTLQMGNSRTTFTATKLLPEDQFWGWETIRPGLGEAFQKLDLSELLKMMAKIDPTQFKRAAEGSKEDQRYLGNIFTTKIFELYGFLPRETVRNAIDLLFPRVMFTNQHVRQPTVLVNNMGLAFAEGDTYDISEVLGKVFWLNFQSSFVKFSTRVLGNPGSPLASSNSTESSNGNDQDDSQTSSDILLPQDESPTPN